MKDLLKNKLVWAVVVVIAALGVWLGTKGDDKSGSKSSGTSTTVAAINTGVQNKCNSQINDDLFCKFAGTFANVTAYKMTATDSSGKTNFVFAMDANGNTSV